MIGISGVLLCIFLFRGYWAHHSFSHLGTQDQTQLVFTVLLLVMSLLSGAFTALGIFTLYQAGEHTRRRKALAVAATSVVVLSYICLSVAALFPTDINHEIHKFFAILYFVLYPVGLLVITFIVPDEYSKFASFTRVLSITSLLGTYALYRLVSSAVPAEMYYLIMVSVWMVVFYCRVLGRILEKKEEVEQSAANVKPAG